MKPVSVEVIAYTPTVFYHCQHCEITFQQAGIGDRVHREQAREALPEDLRAEFQDISNWVHDLNQRYGRRVSVRVIDAASVEGFLKSLRYRIRRYPAVVVDRTEKNSATDLGSLNPVIERRVAAAEMSSATVEGGVHPVA